MAASIDLRSENLAFDIDVWYPPLAEHTFDSIFIPLTRAEAQAIVAYYNAAFRSLPKDLTSTAVESLLHLESRIDHALEDSFGSDDGAFLRLCGRSPKDAEPTDPELRAEIWANYQTVLQKMAREQGVSLDDGNLRVAAIAHVDSWLKVHNGAEAMSLLLTSERVFSDMLDWLHYGEPEQIVLRKFSHAFDLSTEFRCYIHHGILLGMSQYDTYAMHQYLQDASARSTVIRAAVQEWIKVKDSIETMNGSYCADFGVDMKDNEGTTALLIEISPFRNCTGPALFSWQGEEQLVFTDRPDIHDDLLSDFLPNQLQEGYGGSIAKTAVYRVRSQPIPGIGDLVEMNWDMRWSPERVDTPKPFRELYAQVALPGILSKSINAAWNGIQRLLLEQEQQHLLFVYGTLKQDCHWHSKYMANAHFLGKCTTAKPQTLVIGQCGVPYMINLTTKDEQAKHVRGELYRLCTETIQNIDEYEGIDKSHYSREEIQIVDPMGWRANQACKAFCYFYAVKPGVSKNNSVDATLVQAPRITEYTVEEQKRQYKPIHHIQVKQLQYLGEEATT